MALIDIGGAWLAADNPAGALFQRFLGACLKEAAYHAANAESPANVKVWAQAMLSDDETSVIRRVRQVIRWALATNGDLQSDPNAAADSLIEYLVGAALPILAQGS